MAQNDVKIRLSVDGGAQVQGALSGADAQLQKLNANLIKTAHYGAGLLVLAPTVREMAAGMLQAADAVTTLNSRLLLATGSAERAASAYESLFQIAQRSRTSFTELGATFASIARAGQTLGLSQQQLLGVTEAIGNAMTISGGSAQSMQAALVQLGQGLASGTLRGEELNSVMEQAPRLAKALADGLGVPIGQLRKLGETGALTSQMVITALERSAPQLAKELASASLTVGQSFTVLSNSAVKFVGEADRATGASATLASALKSVASALDSVGETIAEHSTAFKVIGGTLAGAATVAGVVALGKGLVALAGALGGIGVAVAALNPVTLAILGVGVVAGGAVAASAAYDKTASGIKRLIGQLEGADAELLRLRGVLQANPGDIITGQYVKELERDTPKRIESLRALRQELALLNAGSAGSVAEDARLDRGTQALAERSARATALAEVMRKLSGVNADFLKDLEVLHASYASGDTTLEAYRAQVADLINKEGGGKAMLAKAAAATRNGNEALAERIALMQRLYGGPDGMRASVAFDLRRAEIAETDAVNARMLADAMAAQAQATEEAVKARADLIRQLDASADSVAAQVQRLQDEEKAAGLAAARHISLAEAIELVTIARLQEQRAVQLSFGDEGAAEAIQREIDKRRELAGLVAGKEARQAAADSAKEAAAEWKKTADSLNQSLTDALYRAFESGKGFGRTLRDSLVNTFKSMVLRPIISAVVSPVSGAITGAVGGVLGLGSTGAVAGGLSGASSLIGAGGLLGSAGAFGSGVASGLTAYGAGGSVTGLLGSGSALFSGGIANGLGTIAGALGPIALGAGAIYALAKALDHGGTPHVGAAYSVGTDGRNGALLTPSTAGGWNLSGAWSAAGDTSAAIQGTVQQFTASLAATMGAALQAFGLQPGSVRAGFAADNDDPSAGRITIRGADGRVLTDQQSRYAASASTGFEQFAADAGRALRDALVAADLPGWADSLLADLGSKPTIEAVQTMVQSITQLRSVFSQLGGRMGITEAQVVGLAQAFGGVDALAVSLNGYLSSVYSDSEKLSIAQSNLSAAFSKLGQAVPASAQAYRALVETQDLNTTAGRNTYAALLQLAPAFAEVSAAAAQAAAEQAAIAERVAEQAANAARQVADERYTLEGRLLDLQGDTQALREREIAALDPSNQALLRRIHALTDEKQRIDDLAAAGQGISEFLRDLVTVGGNGAPSLSALRAAYDADLAAAQAGDAQASARLPASARALLESVRDNATSALQVAQESARIADQLQRLPAAMAYLAKAQGSGLAVGASNGDAQIPVRIATTDQAAQLFTGVSRQDAMVATLSAATDRLQAEMRSLNMAMEGLRAEAQASAVNTNKSTRQLQELIDRGLVVRTDDDSPLATVAA